MQITSGRVPTFELQRRNCIVASAESQQQRCKCIVCTRDCRGDCAGGSSSADQSDHLIASCLIVNSARIDGFMKVLFGIAHLSDEMKGHAKLMPRASRRDDPSCARARRDNRAPEESENRSNGLIAIMKQLAIASFSRRRRPVQKTVNKAQREVRTLE